ncbi:hypothetical protein FB45DRAFT_913192 [Roridomyces roridus]|uniref:Replication protein A C-terminal domain-containing protein n=1 Tax=Roridomyces roridus TaxID=1738132 RepID=A0AAD7FQ04_9AGAR|nr:hypothetical protein FB45DRAFT_913192 [Roridomyces roridus]
MSQYNSPYGGGGGFLQGTPGASQDSPGGGSGKSAASQSLRPVTVAQVYRATQMHSEADWVVDGHPIGQITLVGELLSQRVFATNRTFHFDDGTGTIDAKMWMDTPDDQKDELWRGIDPNSNPSYVRLTGSIRAHNGKRHIHASNIRPIADPHEVYFHILDVISVNVILQKGPPGQEQQNSGGGHGQGAYSMQSRPTNAPRLFSSMADAVAEYLRSPAVVHLNEGAFVGDIAVALKAAPEDLSDCVDKMIDEGHVFTTIDDSHIKLAD